MSEISLYVLRLTTMGKIANDWLGDKNKVNNAGNFPELAYNAVIRNSSKSELEGSLIQKLKTNADFKAWRKKILALYKSNPLIKKYRSKSINFGGNDFFSKSGDLGLKLSIGHGTVNATFTESNGAITVNYNIEDTLDLDYQQGRSFKYNSINGALKPIWENVLGGNPAMEVEAKWSETIKK